MNGWRVSSLFGNRAHSSMTTGRNALRAQRRAGLYGNDAEEATYPITRVWPPAPVGSVYLVMRLYMEAS